MSSPDGPEPIEIELLPSDGVASPNRESSPDSPPADVGPEPRGMLVPVVVGIIALGVGWMLGRSGPDTSPSVAPVVASTIAVGDPVATIDPVPTTVPATTGAPQPASPAATTEPARPPMIETDVDVPAALLGQPIEIVAYGNGRQLFHLDLGAVTLRSQRVTAQPFGRARLLVGPTWALFPSNDADLSSTIVWDDGRAAAVEAGTSDQILGVADGGALWWVVPAPDLRAGVIVQRRTVQGEFDEVIAGVPVAPSGVDPAGGVLLELADGWFGVEPQRAVTDPESGAARVVAPAVASITSGRLLAISTGLALVEECDDRLVCARIVVDRATGERRSIEPDEYTGPVRYALVGGSSVAPGGRSAVVEVLDPDDRASTQRSLGVVDLATGEVDDIGPTQDVDQVAWTPDGRFLLFIAGGRVVAYDTEAILVSVVAEELVAIDAFGVRPAGE